MNLNEKLMKPKPSLVKYAETTPLFTLGNLRELYGPKATSMSLSTVLYRLKRQGRILTVCPGVYRGVLSRVPVNRLALPSRLRRDAVIAFHSALEYAGLANQTFRTTYYLSARPRRDVVYDRETYHCVAPPRRLVKARRTDIQVEAAGDNIRATGRERTLVDCLLHLEYSGGVKELDQSLSMFPSFDFEKALEYLKLLKHPWLYARVGYLLDRHSEPLFFSGRWRDEFLRRKPRGVVYLEKKEPGCKWVPLWNLMVSPDMADSIKKGPRT
jgi:predicted transcriptional regulator of viral defense system